MTAPAISAPAPTPTAPAVVETQPQQTQPTDPVQAAVAQLTPQTPQAPAIAEADTLEARMAKIGRKMSEQGKAFVEQSAVAETHPAEQGVPRDTSTPEAPQGEQAPAADAVEGATPPTLVPAIELEDADGTVALRARDPKTGQFSDMDQSRLYEMSIKDKTTGETRVYQKSLPDLMRMAKQGLHYGEAQNEIKYYRENVPKWSEQAQTFQAQLTDAESRAQRLEALAVELLTADEDLVVRKREEYARQFTPESENARLRAQLQQLQNRAASPQPQAIEPPAPTVDPQIQQATFAFAQRTAPVVQEVEQMVGREAAVGQMALFTLPLLVNGQIPPQKLPELEAYILGPYRQWAQALSASKTTQQQQQQRELDQARAIQQKAQQAANSIGAATRPLGGTPSNAPITPPPARNREELISRIARGRPQTQMAG